MIEVKLYDGFKAEETAKLQSLLSRSDKTLEQHIQEKSYENAGEFIKKWFVDVRHRSIGDCGHFTLYFNDVSMLCAKAIQSHQLYSGLERSTRYQDFGEDTCYDPLHSIESKNIICELMSLYDSVKDTMIKYLKNKFPKPDDVSEASYNRKIQNRAFDVARGFLPVGTKTALSWHTSIRTAVDYLNRLLFHPLPEVRNVANKALECCKQQYPSAFSEKLSPEISEYYKKYAFIENYFTIDKEDYPELEHEFDCYINCEKFNNEDLIFSEMGDILQDRPKGAELTHYIRSYGLLYIYFNIDFGCYRDIHRHRMAIQKSPLINYELPFHPWYIKMLPNETRNCIQSKINHILNQINALPLNKSLKQYYYPMGIQVPVIIDIALNDLIYMLELRTNKDVHPIIRRIMHSIYKKYTHNYQLYNYPIYANLKKSELDIDWGYVS